MRISESRRMLFIHVQKTGGSTVQYMLDEHLPDSTKLLPKHAGLASTLKRHPDLADYWTFGFVRNPWARMVSWWSMIRAAAETEPEHRFFANKAMWRDVAAYPDFDTFIMQGPQRHRPLATPQLSYLQTAKGRRADFIGRTETFEADMRTVLERLEISQVEIPHLNPSDHTSHRDFYSASSRDRVAALFAPDIRTFGYEF